jgi:hypothetical protein
MPLAAPFICSISPLAAAPAAAGWLRAAHHHLHGHHSSF